MNHIGLFEGIGGFSYAAQLMGWETIAWCEINPFCQTVLKYHFPKAAPHGDIKQTDFTIYRGQCDILTGGFPCQPYSNAGKRKGKDDERHLWPEMLRAIREISPRWVVGENVRGLTNWNGGLVFDEVQADLETEGYEVTPFLLPACAVNAPHRRDRIWFIAYRNGSGIKAGTEQLGWKEGANIGWKGSRTELGATKDSDSNGRGSEQRKEESEERGQWDVSSGVDERVSSDNGEVGVATDSSRIQLQRGQFNRSAKSARATKSKGRQSSGSVCAVWEEFPTQSPLCNGDDGLSSRLDSAALLKGKFPRQPWRAFGKWRQESIKGGGNAIVPQLALQIYKAIDQYDSNNN